MAVLTALPELHIIDGFKGTLDFYVHRGIPCCRRWPRWRKRTPYPAEAAAQATFAYATQYITAWPNSIITAYQQAVTSVPYRWQDLAIQGYISGITHQVAP